MTAAERWLHCKDQYEDYERTSTTVRWALKNFEEHNFLLSWMWLGDLWLKWVIPDCTTVFTYCCPTKEHSSAFFASSALLYCTTHLFYILDHLVQNLKFNAKDWKDNATECLHEKSVLALGLKPSSEIFYLKGSLLGEPLCPFIFYLIGVRHGRVVNENP